MLLSLFKSVVRGVGDAIFPPRCLKCGSFLTTDESLIINQPAERLNSPYMHFAKYFCSSCFMAGGGVTDSGSSGSANLSLPPFHKIEILASSKYEGMLKESIHLLKYGGKTGLADPLGSLLFQTFARYYESQPVDLIIPIPLYRLKMVKRGFNQSFLLVRNFKEYWLQYRGVAPLWRIAPELLVRERNTKSQTGFDREQRQKNVQGAFAVRRSEKCQNRHIVIVDDVHTTGATVTEAGKVLIEAGAASVAAIVVAQA